MKKSYNKKQRRSFIAILLCFALLITGLFAFLSAHDAKINRFTLGEVKVVVREPDWTDENNVEHNGWYSNEADANGNYPVLHDENGNGVPDFAENIVPGQTIDKAPYAENTGSLDSWTYLMVGVPTTRRENGYKLTTSERTQQITVRAFSTQTGYVEGQEDAQAVWAQFRQNNEVYGNIDNDTYASINPEVGDITSFALILGGNSDDAGYIEFFKTREAFEDKYDELVQANTGNTAVESKLVQGTFGNDNPVEVSTLDEANVFAFAVSEGATGSVNGVPGGANYSAYYDDQFTSTMTQFQQFMSIISAMGAQEGLDVSMVYKTSGGQTLETSPENLFIITNSFPEGRLELFVLNDLDTTDFTLIPYDSEGHDYFPCVDGYNYYVYAYNSILPAEDDLSTVDTVEDRTPNLFTSVTLNPEIHMARNHSNSFVSVDITIGDNTETVVFEVNDASELNALTVTNLLVTRGYDRSKIQSVSYLGTPEDATTWVSRTAGGETYRCAATIAE